LPGAEGAAYDAVWHGKGALAWWLSQRRLALSRSGEPGVAELARVRRELASLLLTPDAPARPGRLAELSRRKEKLEQKLARLLPDLTRALEANRKGPGDLSRDLLGEAAFIDLLRYERFGYDPKKPGRDGERRTPCYVAFVLCRGWAARRVDLILRAEVD
jgi:hypothetical protein